MKVVIYILLLGGYINGSLMAQTEWDLKYKKISIDSLINSVDTTKDGVSTYVNNLAKGLPDESYFFNTNSFKKYQIQVIYEDTIRPMDKLDKKFMNMWGKMYRVDSEYKNLFEDKLLGSVNGKQYWFFIQKSVLHYYKSELVKADKVVLYIMYLGIITSNKDLRYVFVANEFKKI